MNRQIDYKEMTLGEAYSLYEEKNKEFECDGDKQKLVTKIDYEFKQVRVVKKENRN